MTLLTAELQIHNLVFFLMYFKALFSMEFLNSLYLSDQSDPN